MRLSRSVKEPAELLCFLWDGEAERGRPSAFLWHARSHGGEQRALFCADRSCVWRRPALPPSLSRLPSLRDEYVSFFSCQSLKYVQMKTQTHSAGTHWYTTHTHTQKDMTIHTAPQISTRNQNCGKLSGLIPKFIRRKLNDDRYLPTTTLWKLDISQTHHWVSPDQICLKPEPEHASKSEWRSWSFKLQDQIWQTEFKHF